MNQCTERYYITDTDGFSIAMPLGTQPESWLPKPEPNVVRIPLSHEQRRIDDYMINPHTINLTSEIRETNEESMIRTVQFYRTWIKRSRWLQRAQRAITRLHDGNDIGLDKSGSSTRNGKMISVVVQDDIRWFSPTGEEVPA